LRHVLARSDGPSQGSTTCAAAESVFFDVDNTEQSQLGQILLRRRDVIADQWIKAIAQTSFASLDAAQTRQRLVDLTDQVIAALLAEPPEDVAARAIGVSLARLHYVQPEALGRTVRVLAAQLLQDLSPEQAALLQPRLTALLGALVTGFIQQIISTVLSEQEQIRGALVASLQEAEAATRVAYDQVESKVRERTAELASANEQLLQEIAERKRAEEALRESEARYRAISELSSDYAYAYRVEPDGAIALEWMTEAFARISGYTVEEAAAQGGWMNIVHPEDVQFSVQGIQAVLSGQSVEREFRIIAKSGQVRWLHIYIQAVWDQAQGRVVRFYGSARDITVRRQAEESLRQRSRDLLQLYRMSQTLTATLDLQQVFLQLVQAINEIAHAEGSSIWLWSEQMAGVLICRAAFPLDRANALVGLLRQAGQGVVGWVAQHGKSALVLDAPQDPRFSPDVDDRTGFHILSLLAVPLRAHDVVIGALEVVNKLGGEFDLHDQSLVETLAGSAAIAIENAQLVETLRQLAVTLQARNEELDAFAHTVAHDLKNPLVSVVGNAALLVEDYAMLSDAERQRSLRSIVRSGHKMDNIINELLLLAGLRNMEAEIEPLDMPTIVAEAQQRLADMIAASQAEIILPVGWPVVLGYAPWVEEVWVNYLSNAIKYGGRPPRMELGAEAQPNGLMRLWVRDNGPGLQPADQARLFTPFTRLAQARARGHGLGLSIVRRIVEKLGGHVGVESQAGCGSLFYFELPYAQHKLPTSPA
jgi:PAS domain S-box-containing protein